MKTKQATVLVLRTCKADMTSTNGFVWPTKGPVTCDDFVADYKCGHGLHGLLWGEGVGALLNWDSNAVWLVVRVDADKIMYGKGDMIGKCKFPDGVVVCCGTVEQATEYIISNGGAGRAVAGAKATAGYSGTATAGDRGTATAGDSGTATAGDSGTATAGDRGTATAGDRGTATAGDRGTATAGYRGTATAGDRGTATAGDRGTATAGDSGTATAGDRGTATAGDSGTATAGYSGTATAGDSGTATAGYRGTATAGDRGIICIRWWDDANIRYRLVVGNVGENGIKENTKYRLNNQHQFVEVTT